MNLIATKIGIALAVLVLAGICVLGMVAAMLGLRRLDNWCARQLAS